MRPRRECGTPENQFRRDYPTGNGPMSPLRRARAISSATRRQDDSQPCSTIHTTSAMCIASLHGMAMPGAENGTKTAHGTKNQTPPKKGETLPPNPNPHSAAGIAGQSSDGRATKIFTGFPSILHAFQAITPPIHKLSINPHRLSSSPNLGRRLLLPGRPNGRSTTPGLPFLGLP